MTTPVNPFPAATTAPTPKPGLGTLMGELMGQTPPPATQPAPTTAGQAFAARDAFVSALPPETLQIGRQQFGQGVGFGTIREVKPGIAITDQNLKEIIAKAANLTQNNGYDEIYFLGQDKKLYVLYAEKSRFEDVRIGYLGRANVGGVNQGIEVVHVNDEDNTFYQGMTSTWRWLQNVLMASFGNEASKSVSGLVTTAVGSFVAAAALKGSAPTVAAPVAGGFFKTVGGAFTGAVNGFVQTMASVVLFGVGAVGLVSVFTGIKGHVRKGDMTTIDMITGQY